MWTIKLDTYDTHPMSHLMRVGKQSMNCHPMKKPLSQRSLQEMQAKQENVSADDIGMDVSAAPWITPTTVLTRLNGLNHRHGIGVSYMQCKKMNRPFTFPNPPSLPRTTTITIQTELPQGVYHRC